MAQKAYVFILQHGAAPGRDYKSLLGGKRLYGRSLAGPEAGLAFTGKNLGNLHPGLQHDHFIRIHETAAAAPGKDLSNRGLAAGRHSAEHYVLLRAKQAQILPLRNPVRERLTRKQLAGAYCLAHKHIKAAFGGDAFGCGIQYEAGTERIIDTVKHSAKPLKRVKVQDSPLPVGIHPHGSGVHDDIAPAPASGIGKRQFVFRARIPHRIPHAHGSHRYGGGTYRLCCAAPAQYDRAGSGEIHSGVARKKAKTVKIGIVAVQLAVAVDNSIDGAAAHGRLRQVVQMRHNRLLIGDCHVDALETALPKEWRKGI